jgi:predicted acylesterase/phospholipase RssA
MGAIVGALYSSGYSGAQVDSMIRASPLSDLIQIYEPRSPGVLSRLPALAVWENDGNGFRVQSGAVHEGEVNALLNALLLRGNLMARGDFDRLPIPLRVVATDIMTRTPVVLDSGDLALAVRASAAIPLFFSAIEIDGRFLVDGGLVDNTPVRAARTLGADRIILSALPRTVADPERLDDPIQVALALGQMLFADDTTALRAGDITIISPTVGVRWLDFSEPMLDSLVNGGALAASRALANACVSPRGNPAPGPPPRVVNNITILGENAIERNALRTALGLRSTYALSEDSLRNGLLRLGQSDAFSAVWLSPTGGDSVVDFRITTKRSGRQVMMVGLAYDNDMGGRMWGGIADRRLLGWSVEGALLVDVGKYRRELRSTLLQQVAVIGRAFPLYGSLSILSEDVRQFRDSVEFDPVDTEEVMFSAGLRPRLSALWSADLSVESRTWNEIGGDSAASAFGVRLGLSRSSFARRAQFSFEARLNSEYHRLALELSAPLNAGGWVELTPRLRAGWSKDAPMHQTFSFGGNDGFAGFVTGERRGTHEAVASVTVARQIIGPVYARLEIMSGAVGSGSGFFVRDRAGAEAYHGEFVTGGRLGVEVRAPAIDIRLEHGYNNEGRNQAFVRIGRWF